ncbi:MAG: L,D-transpeptidase [Candidatus Latescibacteria bacterium]|nr:L,D-transpeptidase [Candidatus Latescibacterota bacterium]
MTESDKKRPPLAPGLRLAKVLAGFMLKTGLTLCGLGLVPVLYYFWPAVTVSWAQAREDRQAGQLDKAQLDKETKKLRADIARLREETAVLQEALDQRQPKAPYIVVDTNTNSYLMRQTDEVLREGICSTGSGKKLVWLHGGKTWVFNTPKGKHQIRVKKDNFPIWKKPDWAFVEENEKIPSYNDPRRFEEGVLGQYALDIGDSYMLHGTLYKRTLGEYVSHGCVRLDDPDIEYLYNNSQKGTEVYIF